MKTTLLAALLATALIPAMAMADRLDDIKKKAGVLRIAAFDGNPPFGFVDEKNPQDRGP